MNENEGVTRALNLGHEGSTNRNGGVRTNIPKRPSSNHERVTSENAKQKPGASASLEALDTHSVHLPPDGGPNAWLQVLMVSSSSSEDEPWSGGKLSSPVCV